MPAMGARRAKGAVKVEEPRVEAKDKQVAARAKGNTKEASWGHGKKVRQGTRHGQRPSSNRSSFKWRIIWLLWSMCMVLVAVSWSLCMQKP